MQTTKTESLLKTVTSKHLSDEDKNHLKLLEDSYRMSFQQLKQISGMIMDAKMWQEADFTTFIFGLPSEMESHFSNLSNKQKGQKIFKEMTSRYQLVKEKLKSFSEKPPTESFARYKYEEKELKGRILRLCPAASERAVCCNLKVLNIVENCAMECSYCVLQNHYDEATIKIPSNLKEKLKDMVINPDKKYRICTGEYSDSLMWGNSNNILTDLCEFAERHPNIVLEFKTKSTNIDFFKHNKVPKNICCSWSLNPQDVISHEELKTASLEARINAARTVADLGIKVSFHLHPMMYFEGWEKGYSDIIATLITNFAPEEVLWVSLGTVTLMKGFENKLRESYNNSKILQMPTEVTPDDKITYSFDIRKKLYLNALNALKPWKSKVFQYLCMEHNKMWDEIMDYTFPNMKEFDNTFNDSVFPKI